MGDEDEDMDPTVTTDTEPAQDSEVPRLRADLEAALQKVEELKDRALRAQADYENLQKRVAREVEGTRANANEALLASLLPVLDDLDQAVATLEGDVGEGVRAIHDNLWKALAAAGLEVVDPAGEPFDAYAHEAIAESTEEDLADGAVKEVVQKGYRYRRRLLRAAKVIVNKRGDEHAEDNRN